MSNRDGLLGLSISVSKETLLRRRAMNEFARDSRVPPELIFDQGFGDLFIVRVAGNVVSDIELGSLEYGAGHLHVPLLVVLGHQHSGAVTAAVEGVGVEGHIGALYSLDTGKVTWLPDTP